LKDRVESVTLGQTRLLAAISRRKRKACGSRLGALGVPALAQQADERTQAFFTDKLA